MNPQVQIQKQQLRREQVELQSAMEQLQDNPESYKMIGSLMIKQDAETIKTDLQKQLDAVSKQLQLLESQENES